MDFKSVFASKTIWGAIVMIVPTILGLFGITAAESAQAVNHVTTIVSHGVELVGFVMVLWGRLTATKALKLF